MGMLHRSLGAKWRHLGMKGFQATSETAHSLILASSSQCVRSMAFPGLISEHFALVQCSGCELLPGSR